MVRQARAKARIPRQIGRKISLTISIEDQRLSVDLGRSRPRFEGDESGADVVVSFECEESLSDEDIAARGEDFLIRATHRAFLTIAFEGGNQKRVEQLTLAQFEDRIVEVDEPGGWKTLPLPTPASPGRIRLTTEFEDNEAQQRLDRWVGEFEPCGRLWHDVLVSFYEGRYAEVLLFARAFVELTWSEALKIAFSAMDTGRFPGNMKIAKALRRQASDDRMGLADRIEMHAPVYFGFYFADEFDKEEWARFITFLKQRNTVAHGTGQIMKDDAWRAMKASIVVAEKILVLASTIKNATPSCP
jgi:hypothetical protein